MAIAGAPLMQLPPRRSAPLPPPERPLWMERATAAELAAVAMHFPFCRDCGRRVPWVGWTADPVSPATMTVTIRCHGIERSREILRAVALRGELPDFDA